MVNLALQRACDIAKGQAATNKAKGQTALAEKIGTVQSNIWQWLYKAKKGVPAEWCPKIEAATGVTRYELRPDIDWDLMGSSPSVARRPTLTPVEADAA